MSDKTPSVLLVDDDASLVELMGGLLEDQGFLVTPCSSAEAALQLLESLAFDAVVTDVVFDGSDERRATSCVRLPPSCRPNAVGDPDDGLPGASRGR